MTRPPPHNHKDLFRFWIVMVLLDFLACLAAHNLLLYRPWLEMFFYTSAAMSIVILKNLLFPRR